jgi:predicted ribosomally synthesized peptide with nif11-like leader
MKCFLFREISNMSSSEVERFVSDLKTDDGLRSTLAEHASGVGSIVSFANEKGYEITVEEAGAYIQAQAGNELSDDQLDAVSGGKSAQPGGPAPWQPGDPTLLVSSVAISAVVIN